MKRERHWHKRCNAKSSKSFFVLFFSGAAEWSGRFGTIRSVYLIDFEVEKDCIQSVCLFSCLRRRSGQERWNGRRPSRTDGGSKSIVHARSLSCPLCFFPRTLCLSLYPSTGLLYFHPSFFFVPLSLWPLPSPTTNYLKVFVGVFTCTKVGIFSIDEIVYLFFLLFLPAAFPGKDVSFLNH